jgi:hypothetical protein
MNIRTTFGHTLAAALATGALFATLTACGETTTLRGEQPAAPSEPLRDGVGPSVDTRPCAPSIREARREHRTLCVS